MNGFPEEGDFAPDFTLVHTREEKITLSEVLKTHKVVLIFYLLDFSSP
jgi:peroxiredoxin